MSRSVLQLLSVIIVVTSFRAVEARVWTSQNGAYSLEADAITFNETLVVLKKPTGELVAVELVDLSAADRAYVASKEAQDAARASADQMQTWTSKDGMKLLGRVVAFGRKDLTVQRKLGEVYINDVLFQKLDPLHKKLILKILSELENEKIENGKIEDEKQLKEWAKTIGGEPKVYTLEGVLMKLESGDEIGVPFFLFASEELEILRPGWDAWMEKNATEQSQAHQDFLMRSAAMAYQQDRAKRQQIEMLKLEMLATMTGVISIWEVRLGPPVGGYGPTMSVMVPAANSQIAANLALQKYPRNVILNIRRASL